MGQNLFLQNLPINTEPVYSKATATFTNTVASDEVMEA